MPQITFIQSESAGYTERTRINAEQSDITVALAVDYGTAGERATQRDAGRRYVRVPIDYDGLSANGPEGAREEARLAAEEFLNKVEAAGLPRQDVTLNIAGNGLYTLRAAGIGQSDADVFMAEFLRAVNRSGRMNISHVRSGGQTGIDEAGIKAAAENGIPATVLAPQGWRFRNADNRDVFDESAFKERFAAALNAAEAPVHTRQWARQAEGGFEVSTLGDETGRLFSALNATFEEGTTLMVGGRQVNAGGRTIEDVYQTEIKRSGKNLPPAEDSVVYIPEEERRQMDSAAMEDRSYERGYFPLWAIWAHQHPAAIEQLRAASAGRTLTDGFATGRVSQARALAEIISGRTIDPAVSRITERAGNEALPVPDPAAPQQAPAAPFSNDRDALDLAYAVTFGSPLFSEERSDALVHRLAAMTPEHREDFRTAVLSEVDRLYPELRNRAAAQRAEYGLVTPDAVVEEIVLTAPRNNAAAERLEEEIRTLKAATDPLVERRDTLPDDMPPEEKRRMREELNAQIFANARLRNTAETSLRALRGESAATLRAAGGRETEVSAAGLDGYSLHTMRFLGGTKLGNIDIGNMTVADVFWKYVARTEPGGEPAQGTIVASLPGASEFEKQEKMYMDGILPLVTRWAGQHLGKVEALSARLRRRSPEGALLSLRITDSTSDRFSSARALTDILHGRRGPYSQQELETYFSRIPRPGVHPDLTADRLEGYQVYSVGTSRRSDSEFWSLIPEDTDVIVDMRSNRRPAMRTKPGENVGDFKNTVMKATAEAQGITYLESPALSGALPVNPQNYDRIIEDPRVVKEKSHLTGQGKHSRPNVVYDYGAFAEDETFRAAAAQVSDLVAQGKKVCLVGSEGNAAYSARGLLVGQYLSREADLQVAHIDTLRPGAVRVRSQQSVVEDALGWKKTLSKKNFDQVTFHSDRSYSLPAGEEVIPVSGQGIDDVDERLRAGDQRPWNYGTEVDFRTVPARDYGNRPAGSSGAWASIQANVRYADFTINIRANSKDPQTREIHDAYYQGVDLMLPMSYEDDLGRVIPSSHEACYDQERIIRAADRITRSLVRSITWRYMHQERQRLDLDSIKIFIGGSTLANIANVTQFNEDAYSSSVRARLSNAGYQLDDSTGVTQEDVNHFVTEVLRRVVNSHNVITLDEGEIRPFTITEITSNYDTGIGEAAITAAQRLGLKPTVLYTSPVVTLDENDTTLGVEHRDEAMFRNRARGGLREDVTLDMLQEQIEEKERVDRQRNLGLSPGLSDLQATALWELGFSNTEIVDIMELAESNGIVVAGDNDLYELIERSRGYGVSVPETFDEESVSRALRTAEDNMKKWKDNGITVISAASPLYPDTLSLMPDSKETSFRIEEGDDIGREVRVPYDVVHRRPALLWVKGDIRLLEKESVGILHSPDTMTSQEDKSAIRRFTTVVAANELPLVTSLDNGAATALDMLDADGRVIAISADGIPMQDNTRRHIEGLTQDIARLERVMKTIRGTSTENLYAAMTELKEKGFVTVNSFGDLATPYIPGHVDAFMENKDILLSAADSYPESDLYDALVRKNDELLAQRALYENILGQSTDVAQSIVNKGGLVISQTPPGRKVDPEKKQEQHPNRIVAALSNTCAILAELSASKPMGILEAAARSLYTVVLLVHRANNMFGAQKALEDAIVALKAKRSLKNDEGVQALDEKDIKVIPVNEDKMLDVVAQARDNRRATEEALAREEQNGQEEGVAASVAEERQAIRNSIAPLAPWRESRLYNLLSNVAESAMGALQEGISGQSAPLAQAQVDVIRMGSKTVYSVPQGQDHIADAIRKRFGRDVLVVDPFTAQQMEDRYERGTVFIDGTTLDRFPKNDATAPLRRPASHERLYFNKSQIMTLNEVPNGSMGLPTPAERRSAVDMWTAFVGNMMALQSSFQRDTGFADAAQLQYRNADHLRITNTSVEVRRGDETRCRIWIEDGVIHARNFSLYSDDFQEYHETPSFSVLTDVPKKISAENLGHFEEDIRSALYERPILELRDAAVAEADPALKAEREEKLQNGFLKPRAANLEIAADDVAWAVQEGVLPEKTAVQELQQGDAIRLWAGATRQMNKDAAQMAKLERTAARAAKALEAKPDEEEAEVLSETMADAMSMRLTLALRIEDLRDLCEALMQGGEAVMQTGREKGVVTVSVHGHPVSINTSRLKEEEINAAKKMMQDIIYGPMEDEPVEEAPSKESSQEKQSIEPSAGEGRREEPVPAGEAAAQEKAPDYLHVDPVVEGFSKGYVSADTFFLLDAAGERALDTPLRAIYAPVDGIGVVQDDAGKYRFFDYGNSRPVGEVYVQAGNLSDGLALVRRSDGRLNYLKPDGTYLSKKVWFDDARKFTDGKAMVRVGDTVMMIGKDCETLKVVAQGRAAKEAPAKPQQDKDHGHARKQGYPENKR